MNIKKAVRMALAELEKNQGWLAIQMGISETSVSAMISDKKTPSMASIEKLAKALNKKPSELIALGED